MALRHFGRIDIMEAYSMLGLVEVDFDETYPHHTAAMEKWMSDNEDITLEPALAIANEKDSTLTVILESGSYVYNIVTKRPDTIKAMAQLINITRPSTLVLVDHMIRNVYHSVYIAK